MPAGFIHRNPEDDVVVMRLVWEGLEIKNWTNYSFNSNFETPTDGWHFTIGDDDLTPELRRALYPGARVEFVLNGLVQGHGYIDSIEVDADRSRGSVWKIEGRDVLSPAVDAHVDPRLQFKPGETLETILRRLFEHFDFEEIVFDAEADRAVKLGKRSSRGRGSETGAGTGRGGGRGGRKANQLRPNQHEGVFAFASRIAQRQGLWIWPSVDGRKLIVDRPDYEQPASHFLFRTANGASNILSGAPKMSTRDQPSAIIADGRSGGGEFGRSQIKVLCVNPITAMRYGTWYADIDILRKQYPEAKEIFFEGHQVTFGKSFGAGQFAPPRHIARVLYLHDESSSTLEELEAFVRREMALKLKRFFTARYRVAGHGLYQDGPDGAFVPFATDTTVHVLDEVAGLDAVLYCYSRTFEKSRAGTFTTLEFCLPGALQFGGDNR